MSSNYNLDNPEILESMKRLLLVLEEASMWRPQFSCQALAYLLQIAIDDGIPPHEIAKRSNTKRTHVSKILNTMTKSSPTIKEGSGLNLITMQTDPNYWRQKNCHLTAKGQRWIADLMSHCTKDENKTYGD